MAFELKPGETIKIPTGIRVKINDGWVLKLYPRSGLGFKFRVQMNNTVGIIDSDYYNSDNEGHIDVYKRQAQPSPPNIQQDFFDRYSLSASTSLASLELILAIAFRSSSVATLFAAASFFVSMNLSTTGLTSVSYTHLDVYKRQAYT